MKRSGHPLVSALPLFLAACAATMLLRGTALHAYALSGYSWPTRTAQEPAPITMQLLLQDGPPANRLLLDGSTSWNQVAQAALDDWNQYLYLVTLTYVPNSTLGIPTAPSVDNSNSVFWSKSVYGESWGDSDSDQAIGVTISWVKGSTIVENDVLFNSNLAWDSYRGALKPNFTDLRRVALHEFGHVLGLDHPDGQGQSVLAIMNGSISNTDELTDDDVLGAQALYGTRPSTEAPQIVQQPSAVAGVQGATVTFSVRASPAPVTYQWRKDGNNIASATASILTLPALQLSDIGSYDVVVTNPSGSVVSQAVALTLGLGFTGPPSSQYVVQGGSVTFTASAGGQAPISYQWYDWGQAIQGATASTLTRSGITDSLGLSSHSLTVVATNSLGTVTSSAVNYTVALEFAEPPWVQGVGSTVGSRIAFGCDAAAIAPNFGSANGVALTAGGDLYIVDGGTGTIRKLSTTGVVSTLTGTPGSRGLVDGDSATAQFGFPTSIALDPAGNAYVIDGNYIRRVTPSGSVTTLSGPMGYLDFQSPAGIAVDPFGNLFVCDSSDDVVYEVLPGNTTSVAAGSVGRAGYADGVGGLARFSHPEGIAFDRSGNLYVADTGNDVVRKMDRSGKVTTLAGNPGVPLSGSGIGAAAGFKSPSSIAVDGAGNLFVADLLPSYAQRIREVLPDGTILSLGPAGGSSYSIAVDSKDDLFWSDGATVYEGRFDYLDPFTSSFISLFSVGITYNGMTGRDNGTAIQYQWYHGATAIPGATQASYVIDGLQTSDSGSYHVTATDDFGTVSSKSITISVMVPSANNPFLRQPAGVEVGAGSDVVLSASTLTVNGCQWTFNGVPIPGATGSTLSLPKVSAAAAGSYALVVASGSGLFTSSPAVVTVDSDARLTNLSARGFAGTGINALVSGLGVGGSGTQDALLRGVGPGLVTTFGLDGTVGQPLLTVFDSSGLAVGSNQGWMGEVAPGSSTSGASMRAALPGTMAQLGAFALVPGSADAAMSATIPAGEFTSQLSAADGAAGIGLSEIYAASSGTGNTRLVNLSTRAQVGTAGSILIGGFSIGGTQSETVLIRAVGPGMQTTFGISGPLAYPKLAVYDSTGSVIATNVGWGNAPVAGPSAVQAGLAPATPSLMANAGAFSLSSNSADCAMVMTLPPGNYTAQVSGSDGGTGIALVEIYEVP